METPKAGNHLLQTEYSMMALKKYFRTQSVHLECTEKDMCGFPTHNCVVEERTSTAGHRAQDINALKCLPLLI